MPRNPRITITITPATQDILLERATGEDRLPTEVAALVFQAAIALLDKQRPYGLVDFVHSLEAGRHTKDLDPAELRTKSREALTRLQEAVGGTQELIDALSSAIEDEVVAARLAKVHRLRLAPAGGQKLRD